MDNNKETVEKKWVLVGRWGAPHGLKGECRLDSYTTPPEQLFTLTPWHGRQKNNVAGAPTTTWQVASWRSSQKGFLVRVTDCGDRDDAAQLTGRDIFIERDLLPPPPQGHHYQHDIIGAKVMDEAGHYIGRVKGFSNYGAGDILVIIVDGDNLPNQQPSDKKTTSATKPQEKMIPFQSFAIKNISDHGVVIDATMLL